ncbi:hypothetical protein OPV22_019939 [Ensete ventricosum]|uniref:Secreted protein n=1 Tax=Ensete ventricosum TaxID=4639 RepID=A0AAV8QM41_ENSVE|nr:hypothetical protein OPV22_019939 [Ensete ventricosum]
MFFVSSRPCCFRAIRRRVWGARAAAFGLRVFLGSFPVIHNYKADVSASHREDHDLEFRKQEDVTSFHLHQESR